jgi:small subunit ribosomal protein S4
MKVGETVGVREKSKSLEAISDSLASNSKTFDWLQWTPNQLEGKVVGTPTREMIPENIKEQLIVELYSK